MREIRESLIHLKFKENSLTCNKVVFPLPLCPKINPKLHNQQKGKKCGKDHEVYVHIKLTEKAILGKKFKVEICYETSFITTIRENRQVLP